MKLRKRLKVKARRIKVESAFVDFDDGLSVQVPLFVGRADDPEFLPKLGELATAALNYDLIRKGADPDSLVEVRIVDSTGPETIISWAEKQPGCLVDNYQNRNT